MKSSFIDDGIKLDQKTIEAEVTCKCTARIAWYRIPKTAWKDDEVKAQIDESTNWFAKYCIALEFEELTVDPALEKKKTKHKMADLIDKYHGIVSGIPDQQGKIAKEDDCLAAEHEVQLMYQHLMLLKEEEQKAAGKRGLDPLDAYTVLFLDEWYNNSSECGLGMRPDRVSANSQSEFLIGMTRFDRSSRNMLTHELTHALRRQGRVRHSNKRCFDAFIKTNQVTDTRERSWEDHYAGNLGAQAIAMTRPSRADGTAPETDLEDSRLLSIREYLTILWAGEVECKPGCDMKSKPGGAGAE